MYRWIINYATVLVVHVVSISIYTSSILYIQNISYSWISNDMCPATISLQWSPIYLYIFPMHLGGCGCCCDALQSNIQMLNAVLIQMLLPYGCSCALVLLSPASDSVEGVSG
jgi:hypothetical protein